jgi:hypothetical protein
MDMTLFLALVGVYVLGIAGVVVSGSIVGPTRVEPRDLETRLALVRSTDTDESGTAAV